MGAKAYQITSFTFVYSTVYSDADQRKHQSSASLAFVWGIHTGPVNSPHKWPVTRKMFPFDDVIIKFDDVIIWENEINRRHTIPTAVCIQQVVDFTGCYKIGKWQLFDHLVALNVWVIRRHRVFCFPISIQLPWTKSLGQITLFNRKADGGPGAPFNNTVYF